jgi:hypothetical protein
LAFHSEREADHSPPSSAEVKEWVELYLHSPNTPSWRGTQEEQRDNFTFNFTYVRLWGCQCFMRSLQEVHKMNTLWESVRPHVI